MINRYDAITLTLNNRLYDLLSLQAAVERTRIRANLPNDEVLLNFYCSEAFREKVKDHARKNLRIPMGQMCIDAIACYVELPADLLELVKKRATKEGISPGVLVKYALAQYLNNN